MPLVRQALELPGSHLLYEILARLAPRLAKMDQGALQLAWREVLRTMSLRPRTEFFALLALLLPVVRALAGPQGVFEVTRAIQTLRRWWP